MARSNFGVMQDPLKFFENGRGVEYPADKYISTQNRPYHRLWRRDFRVLLIASFPSRSIVSGLGSVLELHFIGLNPQAEFVPIHEQPDHNVVHLNRFREAYRFTSKTLDACA